MNLLENTEKIKSRWLFSTVIGNYGSEYSETTMIIHYCNDHYGNKCTNCCRKMPFSAFNTVMGITVMNIRGAPWVVSLYSVP